jgi:hypothetical protein
MLRYLTLMATVFFTATGVAMAVTWTVDDDGPADFSSIQAAVGAATNGDEIVVMPGRYRETVQFLGKSITVRSQAGPERTIVYLEGETRIVVMDGDSTLQGFTIRGGGSVRTGGGILVTGNSRPVISDNIIENNTVSYNEFTGFPGLGAGIAIEQTSEPIITRNVIRGNLVLGDPGNQGQLAYGGAIDIGDYTTATITDNVIANNKAEDTGGGVSITLAGTTTPVVLTNNTIVSNDAGGPATNAFSLGGGVSVYDDAEAVIENNAVVDNFAAFDGGGIYFSASNLTGLDYDANDFDGNLPNNCAGLTLSKCYGGQFEFPALFQDAGAGIFRLRSDSELIDRGVTGSQSSADLDGRLRSFDGDLDGAGLPDIGAYENHGESTRLRFDDKTTLSWDGSRNSSVLWDVYRDWISVLATGPIGLCWKGNLSTTTTSEPAEPTVGDGYFYLAVPYHQSYGNLGFDSDGVQRITLDPCP